MKCLSNLSTLFIVLSVVQLTTGYFLHLDANEEQCFFERVKTSDRLGFIFEVAEGGFVDISYTITGPTGEVLSKGERETSGKQTLVATMDGVYNFCLSNKMSTMTPKTIVFTIEVIEAGAVHNAQQPGADAGDADSQKLGEMINELSSSLTSVLHELAFITSRSKIHHLINQNTNFKVTAWAVFEAVLLVSLTLGQIFYLKRFFEVRRVV
uniref:GOLD domain-containing protein n=1 Tax=Rhabditophanes sp. KR3021 TaxID=114890 RepID=A0AC35U3N2_9BILA